jgi:hypothetical protein
VALFIQTGFHGEINVIAEYYRTHRTDDEFASDVRNDSRLSYLVSKARCIYPEPADPGATATLAREWGLPVQGGTGGPLKGRRTAIEHALRFRNPHLEWGHPERVPYLRFDRTCTYSRYEMDNWRWPDKRKASTTGPEEPEDKDNHVPEALGRFFAGHGLVKGSQTVINDAMGRTGRRTVRGRARR